MIKIESLASFWKIILFFLPLCLAVTVLAQEEPQEVFQVGQVEIAATDDGDLEVRGEGDDSWSVEITPVLWLPGVEGGMHENGLYMDVHASQESRRDHLSPGGEILLEVEKGRLTFAVQPQYSKVRLDGRAETPIGDLPVDVKVRKALIEFWVGYRLNGEASYWVDIVAGGRRSRHDFVGHSALGTIVTETEHNDPLVGLRGGRRVSGKWQVEGLVTASGFGAFDSSSNRTWEMRLGAEYSLTERFALSAGYRTLKAHSNQGINGQPQVLRYKLRGVFLGGVYKVK